MKIPSGQIPDHQTLLTWRSGNCKLESRHVAMQKQGVDPPPPPKIDFVSERSALNEETDYFHICYISCKLDMLRRIHKLLMRICRVGAR